MKKQAHSFIFFMALLFIMIIGTCRYSFGEAAGNESLRPLRTAAHIFQNNGIETKQWTVYTREYSRQIQNDAAFFKKLDELKRENRAFRWALEENHHMKKATGIYKHPFFQEKIQLIMTATKDKPQTYILYEAKGQHWSEKKWEEAEKAIERTSKQLFVKQPTFFTCMNGEFSGNMKGGLFHNALHLLREFQATPVESLREDSLVSLSAYTEQWGNILPTNDHPMNIQLALRERLGGKTSIVVGTPIITIEY
ncbi:YwmB family TATA-box binding protein [Parageobacillus thermoglucosidasius]|uniref:YwmB family TATA-box binding protein n=2 Tax=Parageobacillus thermoglucosidasius TaxID=1426 RepID=A0AB38R229_PARTM|nr:YwmB family TATA-box binding protein [Parageobacillus thermoglucosidasius]